MAILRSTDILDAGESYTFTYDSGKWFQSSEQSVFDQLRPLLVNYGEVISVKRGFMSGRYAITCIPNEDFFLKDWQGGFDYSFASMGWNSVSFVQAEGGAKSSQSGGLSQVVTETAGGVASLAGDSIFAVLKPLAPYLIIGAGVLLTLEYMKGRNR